MKKILTSKVIWLIIVSGGLFSFYEQTNNTIQVYWSENRNLSWSDYLATPDMADTSNVALTYYGIASAMKTKGDSVIITVRSIFDKEKSWVKPNDKTDSLLTHEQGHFDIAELYARILKKTLKDTRFKKATLGVDFNKVYKNNSANLNAEQGVYDEETNHGRIPSKQLEWNKKIKNRLDELDLFSKDKVTAFLSR